MLCWENCDERRKMAVLTWKVPMCLQLPYSVARSMAATHSRPCRSLRAPRAQPARPALGGGVERVNECADTGF